MTIEAGWPAELADRYRAEGYWRGRALGDLLADWATEFGPRTALVGKSGVTGEQVRLSYTDLDGYADRLATGLRSHGIGAGDRVVVQLPNLVEFVGICFALFRIGAQPVLALPAHRALEIRALCQVSEAVAYVVPDRFARFDYRELASAVRAEAPSLRHVFVAGEPGEHTPFAELEVGSNVALDPVPTSPRALSPQAPGSAASGPAASCVALFLLSGGTTGLPKLIPRTHDDYAYNLTGSAQVCRLTAATTYLAVLPVAHNFAFGCPGVLGTLSVGGTVVLAPAPEVGEAFALIERERVTVTALVPPLVLLWLEAKPWTRRDLSSLQLLQVGGAKLAPEVARRVGPELECGLQQVFGMAEGLLCYTRLDDDPELIVTTQGRPMSPADEVRIVDDSGTVVPFGTEGHLLTRGPYTLRGYFRAPEHNARTFTADGFYRSGDLVTATPSGNLIVSGRAKDVINRGGEKVSAEEVENHLLAHPQVLEAAVVAMPDAVLGERTCAYLVPRGTPPTVRELGTFLRDRGLAEFQLPDRVEVTDSLPRTPVGKISKQELTARQRARVGGPS